MSIIKAEQGMLTIRCNNEIVWIEPWGRDALRVRACKQSQMPEEAWALENKGNLRLR